MIANIKINKFYRPKVLHSVESRNITKAEELKGDQQHIENLKTSGRDHSEHHTDLKNLSYELEQFCHIIKKKSWEYNFAYEYELNMYFWVCSLWFINKNIYIKKCLFYILIKTKWF